jgi:hypothetical protein
MKNDDFYAGIGIALQIIALHDAETMFREIVSACNEKELLEAESRNGNFEIDGFAQYGYKRPRRRGY